MQTSLIMEKFVKPIVGISKCLEFDNCRFDGKILANHFIRTMKKYVEFLPVCPEVGIGLGTPRKPIRLVKIGGNKNLYQPSTGENLTEKMNDFSEKFLESIKAIDGFILKHSSPTCGVRNVKFFHKIGKEVAYDRTTGIFTEAVMKKFPQLIIEDEGRLRNMVLRDSFLTRLFTMANLRSALSSNSKDGILDFYSKNQILFMCYNHEETKKLGGMLQDRRILEKTDSEILLQKMVFSIMNKIPDSNSFSNSFMYIFSLIEQRLSSSEKDYFKSLMSDFSQGHVSFYQVSTLLYSWGLRFELKDILSQTIFNPYPKQLVHDLQNDSRQHSMLKL